MGSPLLLQLAIWSPAVSALLLIGLPFSRARAIRAVAMAGSSLSLACMIAIAIGFDPEVPGVQYGTSLPWIPGLSARYDTAVDGISLVMLLMTAVIFVTVTIWVRASSKRAKSHAFLFAVLQTGLMGLFSARDLLLFYVFFEVGLVPMYFIIGGWGHAERRPAAIKFFLYTRAGSLAMLLSFLALYLSSDPHTFSLEAISRARPLAGALPAASWVFFGMLLGFGVKIPVVPLHNWLPDAHVEAPTEGSVVLAAVQLKMGGYGLLRIALPTLPDAAVHWSTALMALGVVSILYGMLAALAQTDFKRLVAYTSIAHMGFVTLGAGLAAANTAPEVNELAIGGAVYQMVSHGVLTGAMFLMAGVLQTHAGTRDIPRLSGLLGRWPSTATLLGVLAFASMGLPLFSGFIAELQIIAAAVEVSLWAAGATIVGLAITTGLYVSLVTRMLMGKNHSEGTASWARPGRVALLLLAGLTLLSLVLGVWPWPVLETIRQAFVPEVVVG